MKRNLLLILAMFFIISVTEVKANPIYTPPPQAFISEVYFPDNNGDWVIEIEIDIPALYQSGPNIDSIVIRSNLGRSKLSYFPGDVYSLILINNYLNPVSINSNQDTIILYTYLNPSIAGMGFNSVYEHQLVYGYPNCGIPVLNSGQSICMREHMHGFPLYFYLDNVPSLGMENDTTGATATIHGRFYDFRDSLINYSLDDRSFALYPNIEAQTYNDDPWCLYFPLSVFTFDGQGYYTTHVLARDTAINKIGNQDGSGYYYGSWSHFTNLSCTQFSYNLEPGQTLEQDIHLNDSSFYVGVSKIPPSFTEDLTVVCAPNPVITSTRIFFTSEHSLKGLELKLFDVTGRTIKGIQLPDEQQASIAISKTELGNSGTYIYTVFEQNRILKSGYIICE